MPHEAGHEPGQHAPPLPPSNFNRDDLLQWLSQQTVSAQKLITGSLQADQTVSSSNFSSGSAGWQIDGDGNAEFNNVTVRGDIVSSNWDGTEPIDLSSEDAGATAGFALDASEGAAQFEGDLFINGTVNITADDSTFVLKSTSGVASNTRIESFVAPSGLGFSWFRESDDVEMARMHANNAGTLFVQSRSDTDSGILQVGEESVLSGFGVRIDGGLKIQTSGTNHYLEANRFRVTNDGVTVNDIGSASSPGYSFQGDTDTGIYRNGADELAVTAGGVDRLRTSSNTNVAVVLVPDGTEAVPSVLWASDTDTGIRRRGANNPALVSGGSDRMWWSNSGVWIRTLPTTSSGANAFLDPSGLIHKSTSSLAYKPDWRWASDVADLSLPTPIRWTDEKGQIRLGFGAEHVWGSVPEAYEGENYDLRSLVAILSERVKRLEGRTSLPRRLLEWLAPLAPRARGLLNQYRAAR